MKYFEYCAYNPFIHFSAQKKNIYSSLNRGHIKTDDQNMSSISYHSSFRHVKDKCNTLVHRQFYAPTCRPVVRTVWQGWGACWWKDYRAKNSQDYIMYYSGMLKPKANAYLINAIFCFFLCRNRNLIDQIQGQYNPCNI